MLEMSINNVELGSLKDRVHIVTFCDIQSKGSFRMLITHTNQKYNKNMKIHIVRCQKTTSYNYPKMILNISNESSETLDSKKVNFN